MLTDLCLVPETILVRNWKGESVKECLIAVLEAIYPISAPPVGARTMQEKICEPCGQI